MKNVVIIGAGQVGRYAAEVARNLGFGVTIIEHSAKVLESIESLTDARLIHGSACHSHVLQQTNVSNADVLMAATSLDEVNLLSATIGRKLGAKIVMARIHNSAYLSDAFSYRKEFGIDHIICPERLTARLISSDLSEPNTHQIPRFAQNEIELRTIVVGKASKGTAIPLKDLTLPPGVRLALVKRQGKTLLPHADIVFSPGDHISFISPSHHIQEVLSIFGKSQKSLRNIAIVGGSAVADWLLQLINPKGYRIKLFEKNEVIANKFASLYPFLTVINKDPEEHEIFTSEHLNKSDAYLALSEDQEHNIISALQAKKLGIENCTVVVQSSNFLKILKGSGIHNIYSPRIEAAKAFLQIIDPSPVKLLTKLHFSAALVHQVKVQPQAPSIGKSLAELKFPGHAFIAAIEREDRVFCPLATDTIMKNDILITIGPRENKEFLYTTFSN